MEMLENCEQEEGFSDVINKMSEEFDEVCSFLVFFNYHLLLSALQTTLRPTHCFVMSAVSSQILLLKY